MKILPLVVILLAAASSAAAGPITPTIQGCVSASSLGVGQAKWTAPEHFQMVAFWDPVAGCDPTIAIPIVLHEWISNYDGTGGLMTVAHPESFPACGRIQFDAQSYLGQGAVLDPMGLVSLMVDTGIDCAGRTGNGGDDGGGGIDPQEGPPGPPMPFIPNGPPGPPTPFIPNGPPGTPTPFIPNEPPSTPTPFIPEEPPGTPPGFPETPETPGTPDVSTVPEPASVWLFSSGLAACLAYRKRRSTRRSAIASRHHVSS